MSLSSNFPTIKPSLNLDFANVGALDPRITFTRATTATYYDGVTTALAEQNLLTYSQEFDNAAWAKGANVTLTANGATAPDGTSTADVISTSGGIDTSANRVSQNAQGGVGVCVASIYLRAATTQTVRLKLSSTNGTIITTTSDVSVTSTWTRFTVSGTVASASAGIIVGPAGSVALTNIEIWGAQLEQRSSVTAYTATTAQPITNYIPVLLTAAAGVARFDHTPTTGAALGLLIEEARTNLVTYSEQFDNAYWTKSNVTLSADNSVAPDGTVTADLVKPTSTGLDRRFEKTAITITNATSYTQTVYAKASGINFIYFADINNAYNNVWFDLSAGTVSTPIVGSATITPVGNGWYRCSQTTTSSSTSGTFFVALADSSGSRTSTASGNNGVLLWGAQLEAGSFATSYIATTSASVTRNADVASMTGTNFSSWYNQGEGSFYSSVLARGYVLNQMLFSATDGTLNNPAQAYFDSASQIQTNVWSNGTVLRAATVNTQIEYALGMEVNNVSVTIGGGNVTTDTSAGPAYSYTQFNIGNRNGSLMFNGTIRKVAYYPERLTNAQLQAITS